VANHSGAVFELQSPTQKTKLQLYVPTLFRRWAGHVALWGTGETYTGFWGGKT